MKIQEKFFICTLKVFILMWVFIAKKNILEKISLIIKIYFEFNFKSMKYNPNSIE